MDGNVTPLINVKWKNKVIANVAPKIEMQKHGKGVWERDEIQKYKENESKTARGEAEMELLS